MRLFGGQVHLAECAFVIVLTVLCFLIGASLPLVAGIGFLLWPLLVFQLLVIWLFDRALNGWRRRTGRPVPQQPRRHGVARFIWLAPLVALALGYGLYIAANGTWLLSGARR